MLLLSINISYLADALIQSNNVTKQGPISAVAMWGEPPTFQVSVKHLRQ